MEPILHFHSQADVEKAVSDLIIGLAKAIDAARLAGVECEMEGTVTLDGMMITAYDQGVFTQEVQDDGQTTTATQTTDAHDVTQKTTRGPTETTSERKNDVEIREVTTTQSQSSERKSVRDPAINRETVQHPSTSEIVKNSGGDDTQTTRAWRTLDGNTIS
jgi:hypothetical protein